MSLKSSKGHTDIVVNFFITDFKNVSKECTRAQLLDVKHLVVFFYSCQRKPATFPHLQRIACMHMAILFDYKS